MPEDFTYIHVPVNSSYLLEEMIFTGSSSSFDKMIARKFASNAWTTEGLKAVKKRFGAGDYSSGAIEVNITTFLLIKTPSQWKELTRCVIFWIVDFDFFLFQWKTLYSNLYTHSLTQKATGLDVDSVIMLVDEFGVFKDLSYNPVATQIANVVIKVQK
jgi:hypothetical protein